MVCETGLYCQSSGNCKIRIEKCRLVSNCKNTKPNQNYHEKTIQVLQSRPVWKLIEKRVTNDSTTDLSKIADLLEILIPEGRRSPIFLIFLTRIPGYGLNDCLHSLCSTDQ